MGQRHVETCIFFTYFLFFVLISSYHISVRISFIFLPKLIVEDHFHGYLIFFLVCLECLSRDSHGHVSKINDVIPRIVIVLHYFADWICCFGSDQLRFKVDY